MHKSLYHITFLMTCAIIEAKKDTHEANCKLHTNAKAQTYKNTFRRIACTKRCKKKVFIITI